ncbi:protein translocase SEC61 complex subunit gamma [Candidatus Hecatella orcuttiae]|jgi:protein translocase SEC61 complex gamma subunit|uniref:protein translocase SEC61 complex subunit gamma n=1 Tax=Candidatus Hecatella orcuttiae TaxID=1935119 RepID=UPI002867BA9F|nr:protein translocase SEC61 complex subunit gamma [Candidatus Hecatella orcuttiae]
MGLRSWLTSSYRLLKTASKPSKTEFWLLLRVCILGVIVVGAVGFLIKFISAIIGFKP